MVSAFNDWGFDPRAKPATAHCGDRLRLPYPYFVGEDIPYWKLLAQTS